MSELTKEESNAITVKKLTINIAGDTVKCPKVKQDPLKGNVNKVTVCKKCEHFNGFDYEGKKFVLLCKYVKRSIRAEIIEIIGSAVDYHPNSLGTIADKILELFNGEEDKE